MQDYNLKGWNYIVYILIKNNFKYKSFLLKDLYRYEESFSKVYPKNYHIKDKLRQTLQNLRKKGLLEFQSTGKYQLIINGNIPEINSDNSQELVYLLSNDSIPGWIKIGRTNAIDRRLSELYNTSVPLPFKVEKVIKTITHEESRILEKSIHNIIDTINPNLRKNTEAYKREFFMLSPEEGKSIFELVTKIIGITPNQESLLPFQSV